MNTPNDLSLTFLLRDYGVMFMHQLTHFLLSLEGSDFF